MAMVFRGLSAAIACSLLSVSALAAPDIDKVAADYGARPSARSVWLSPSGDKIVYSTPFKTAGEAAVVADIGTGQTRIVFSSADARLYLNYCIWKTEDRLVCKVGANKTVYATRLGFSRVFSVNADGSGFKILSLKQDIRDVDIIQDGGDLVDALPDDPENILLGMWIPEKDNSGRLVAADYGYSVQRVNIVTGARTQVEKPRLDVAGYRGDNHGNIRFMETGFVDPDGLQRNFTVYRYRAKGSRDWVDLTGRVPIDYRPEIRFAGFDESGDRLLVMKKIEGRYALFSRSPGNSDDQLLFSHPNVDVEGVWRVGKYDRPVAAVFDTDYTELAFFDETLKKRTAALAKAFPKEPQVYIVDESWDGTRNLVFAGGDNNAGAFYRYDTKTHQLGELLKTRPEIAGYQPCPQKSITYKAADGTPIPAYLTFPPSGVSKKLPLVVMPHGGPSARDTRGFDWLAQYWAQLGYVVFQPNYRGSSGYGDSFFQKNGFQSWRTAIGDINDGVRGLIADGTADPAKVVAFGWSYGGYAVLQGAVVDAGLYKSVVAVAPVTDLGLMLERAKQYTSQMIVKSIIGSGPHLIEGSPAKNAERIQVPVFLFQGDKDLNVEITQSQAMDSALKSAGKPHQLVVYPGLDHQLDDSAARADMLSKSARWFEAAIGK
jgi:dipeptidyl aminopeptidase/acylaminoacyl peptidase